ncbi:pyruvate dehydrogenase (acetyl-transferring) kinase isozyme 3, mitochondrial-like isoform X2 [Stylophora pistillata]|uniref:pyruvate dehydrogenase (acetyl-transferring) kinase isozyme 3, mitochondrial-like isoform X2 n=1 Tax=Stylophora pistillata TaxID=50429 RepID=UPI000C041B41|nr:pyruvate dehydrogenase (acetyl-transferring) kinase isozyme 3, mitochondrial-like isoform X2 [Stylophora pistillata]
MRITEVLFKNVSDLIQRFSRNQQSSLSIEKFMSFGKSAKPIKSFKFGRHELPMRLAHTIREFDLLPENLLKIPSVELVRGWYVQSFSEVTELQDEQETDEVLKRYTQCLMDIKQHHKDVVETMAQGIMELRQKEGDDAFHPSIQYFLDAINKAAYLCEHYYCAAPVVEISEFNAVDLEDPIQMADVPGHLYHILSELLKNAM